jgi:hypothetical protein
VLVHLDSETPAKNYDKSHCMIETLNGNNSL